MRKEDMILLSQLLSSMRDAALDLEESYKSKNMERLSSAKRRILEIQRRIEEML